MSKLQQLAQRFSPWLLVIIAVLIVLVLSMWQGKIDAEAWSIRNALRANSIQIELDRQRTEMMPREFKDLSELETWANLRQFPQYTEANQLRARAIQERAAKDGKALSIQVVINSVTKQTEFWPTARIQDKFYTIEPITNVITLFFPTEWWR